MYRFELGRCARTVGLYEPADKPAVAFTAFGPADGKWLILPDAKLQQLVPNNGRHVHDSSVRKRVHDLIAEASLYFQSIGIRQRDRYREIGFKHNSVFHGSPL